MQADDIRLLFGYSYSATGRILDAARKLNPAQFTSASPLEGAHSLQRILVHMLRNEQGWREELRTGEESTTGLDPSDFPDVATLAAAWDADEEQMRAWLATLGDKELNAPVFNGRLLWQYLVHVVNHATQHRSEAAMILTHWGQSPGDLDLVFYLSGWRDD
ncbi:hypothetical protein BH23CHL1_BH23CHL1_22610 [soil metagenome]